jgi:hypothetical protein
MIEIPTWIQAFVLAGVVLVALVVPFRILYEMTKESRDRTRRLQDLTDRLKERFDAVRLNRSFFGLRSIRFTHEGRPVTLLQPARDEFLIRLESKVEPKFHAIMRTRSPMDPPFTFMRESIRFLRRIRMGDPLIDDLMAIYATPIFGGYLRESMLDKPTGLAESLVVLRRMVGVRRFELRISPTGGFRVKFRADDLLNRPDDLESAVHHAFRIYDLLVLY